MNNVNFNYTKFKNKNTIVELANFVSSGRIQNAKNMLVEIYKRLPSNNSKINLMNIINQERQQQVIGGRRTYRKKNRTVRRKTRKIRKAQKGGFTYNIHTKRTALTTSTTRRKRRKLGRKTTTASKKTTTH